MRTRTATAWLTLLLALFTANAMAQEQERAQSAAAAVRDRYGTEQALRENGFEPLSTQRPMQTIAGTPFDAQMSCPASQRFARVTLFPSGTSDIANFTVELDRDLDGTSESLTNFTGPFAGVCNNGVIQCDAGTFNNCRYLRYREANAALSLEPVTIRDLGACYCINASCGNNLLIVNSEKVVSDLAAGIVQTLRTVHPRITTARAQVVDALTVVYYGQESGCGADRSPEQYFSRPNELANAGAAEAARPGTLANFVLGTSVAAEHDVSSMSCELRRDMETTFFSKNDVLRLGSSTRGATFDCGPGCLRFRLGLEGDNYYFGGSCGVFTESAVLEVLQPGRVRSLRLTELWFDDHAQFRVGGNVVFSSQPGWNTGPFPATRCERRNRFSAAPNVDLSAAVAAVGAVPISLRTAVGDAGEGWSFLQAHIDESCAITNETIVDGCTAVASNPECRLEEEFIDGVQTVRNFMTTGLTPLPTAREVGLSCRLDSGARPWWLTQRRYRCRTQSTEHDFSAAEERYRAIHESFDPDNGNFTDRRVMPAGAQLSSESLTLPPVTVSNDCIPMCRTRRPRPGIAVGDVSGAVNTVNAGGVAYDFTFKECEPGGSCPLDPGEEEVAPCDCRSNFAQAAALMQTIRLVGKDMVCTAPSP